MVDTNTEMTGEMIAIFADRCSINETLFASSMSSVPYPYTDNKMGKIMTNCLKVD